MTSVRRHAARGLVALAAAVAVVAVLIAGLMLSGRFEITARQALYRDPIVAAERSAYQDIVITENRLGATADTRLYLNGDLQFSSVDEHRYHETLVHPAMSGNHDSVLILGGGDGLALREVLTYPDARDVTLVELDPEMIRLARTDERLTTLNRGSMTDPRAEVIAADGDTVRLRTANTVMETAVTELRPASASTVRSSSAATTASATCCAACCGADAPRGSRIWPGADLV